MCLRYIAAIILESIYGHRITSLDDEYVTLMYRAMEATTATGAAGATPADILPFRESRYNLVLLCCNAGLSFITHCSQVHTVVGAWYGVQQARGIAREEAGLGRAPLTVSHD